MSLATLSSILEIMKNNKSCVGCFSAYSFEFIQAIITAASLQKTPVVVSLDAHNFTIPSQLEVLAMTSFKLAKSAQIPVAVHLNHCRDLNLVENIASYGFTSIMFDGSSLPLSENVAATREVVKIAHRTGASVEGEIRLANHNQATDEIKVSPYRAAQFARETGIDCLAASIGDRHGMKNSKGDLDLPLIKALGSHVDIPLALHKGSWIKSIDIQKAISLGVRKVNFNNEIQATFNCSFDSVLKSRSPIKTQNILYFGYQELLMKVQEKLRILQ